MDKSFTAPYAIDTILFTVQQASGLHYIEKREPEIFIYPVPATTAITVKLPYPNDGYYIGIYSNIGHQMVILLEFNTELKTLIYTNRPDEVECCTGLICKKKL